MILTGIYLKKLATLSNDSHNNSSAEMVPAVDIDSSLQSSLDEFSEETFDKLEEGAFKLFFFRCERYRWRTCRDQVYLQV